MTDWLDASVLARLDPPALAGGRCPVCATVAFPLSQSCSRCGSGDVVPIDLAREGVLWSWTVQHFAPKPPFHVPDSGFAAFALGYVDLGEVLVETLLVPADHAWRIGEPVRLDTATVATPDGPATTFAFSPQDVG